MEFPSPSRTKQWNYLTHNILAKEKRDGEGNSIVKPPLPCGIPIYGKGFGRKPSGFIQCGTYKVPPVLPGKVLIPLG
jgi:hypothetical protein